MRHFVFFLEEESAKEMLRGFLPKVAPAEVVEASRYIVFEGKQDLEKNLVRRLRGYLTPGAIFVVLRDQDAAECTAVKARLVDLCTEAGRPETLVRVACRALESWYLADLTAVERGLEVPGLARLQAKARYRNPDRHHHPDRMLSELTEGRYQKVSGSRRIGPCLAAENENSPSFRVLVQGLRGVLAKETP